MCQMGQGKGSTIYFRCSFWAKFSLETLVDKTAVHQFLAYRTKNHTDDRENCKIQMLHIRQVLR